MRCYSQGLFLLFFFWANLGSSIRMYLYVSRMYTRMLLVCTCMNSYVSRMLLVCYPYGTRMLPVCYPYDTRMYSYVPVCHSYVTVWCISRDRMQRGFVGLRFANPRGRWLVSALVFCSLALGIDRRAERRRAKRGQERLLHIISESGTILSSRLVNHIFINY